MQALETLSPSVRCARAVAIGSLAGIAVLKLVMLFALFSRTPPFPPEFLSPFIGAALALAALGGTLLIAGSRLFIWPITAFALTALLSFGPHKLYPGANPFFFAQTPAVYPAIIVGSLLIACLAIASVRFYRALRQ
jgi:hypothetical protein